MQHGGVAYYVRDTIPTKPWPELDKENTQEVMFLTIRPHRMLRDTTHITLGVVYHPPGANDKAMTSYLSRCIDRILQHHPHIAVVLCGDFSKLKDSNLKTAHDLKQLVKQPTRDRAIL